MERYAELKQILLDSLIQFSQSFSAYLPKLLGALMLLALGFLLAWGAKWLILRLGAGIDRMVQAIGTASSVHIRLKWPLAEILGWLSFWLIILFFLTAAVESLGLPALAEWLGRMLTYLPSLLIALIIIFGGVLLGNSARDRITAGAREAGLHQVQALGSFVRLGIITLAVIVGLAQIGLDVRLIEHIMTLLVAALLASVALAFGLGAGPTVSNIISARYVRKNYRVGQTIRIDDLQGKILELLPTGIVLETESGRTFIPASVFDRKSSVLLDDDSFDGD